MCYLFQASQKDLSMTEPLYNKIHEAGKLIKHSSDAGAKQQIQTELDTLDKQWLALGEKLNERKQHLESILNQWSVTEDEMEEVLTWLKDIRKSLVNDLPDSYDELQKELQLCTVSLTLGSK